MTRVIESARPTRNMHGDTDRVTPQRGAIRRYAPARAVISRLRAAAFALASRRRRPLATLTIRVALLCLGAALIAAGVAGLLWTGLGPGPLDVFITSIVDRWGIPITFVIWGMAVVMITISFWLGHRAGPGTVLLPLVSGALLPVFMGLYDHVAPPSGVTPIGVAAHIAAVAVMGVGAGAVIVAGLGAGSGELLAAAASDHVGRPEPLVRTGVELTWLVFGIALGGTFGLGTVIVTALIGPAVRNGHTAVSRGARWARPRLVDAPVIGRALAPGA